MNNHTTKDTMTALRSLLNNEREDISDKYQNVDCIKGQAIYINDVEYRCKEVKP